MRRTWHSVPRRPVVLLLALLATGCDGGESDPIARPHELRLTIVRGAGMRVPVRPVGTPAGEVSLPEQPIVVQVSALIGASGQTRAGATGPALDVRLPPVELRWRALQRWCEPLHATTTLAHGDTVHNYYRRPTLADACQMVVEGVSNGWVFDADTALVKFDPGPLVSITIAPRGWLLVGVDFPTSRLVGAGRDAYGNFVDSPPVAFSLTEGQNLFAVADTIVVAEGEGKGAATVATGAFTQRVEMWGVPDLEANAWRITWGCKDVARPGESRADSIHFVMDSARAARGQIGPSGWNTAFTGRVTLREWRTGEPPRTEVLAGYTVIGSMRPHEMEWSPGEVSRRTLAGYAGASLCAQTLNAPAGGSVAVRVDRR